MTIPPSQQLKWFAQALDQLEAFLLSDQVFQPLGGLSMMPRQDVSLGGLLLTADVLGAPEVPLTAADRAEASRLLRRWEVERSSHGAAIERKAVAEARQRANLWKGYVGDLLESEREAGRFPVEVRHRVALERLLDTLGSAVPQAMRETVRESDQAVQRRHHSGKFIWEDFLRAVYPPPAYWYLYGSVQPTQS